MRQRCSLFALACVLLAAPAAAVATPYTLPNLGWTIDIPGSWTVQAQSAESDYLSLGDTHIFVSTMAASENNGIGCRALMRAAIDAYNLSNGDEVKPASSPSQVPSGWLSFYVTKRSDSVFAFTICRVLDSGSLLVIIAPANESEPFGGVVPEVLAALETAAVASGQSVYQSAGPEKTLEFLRLEAERERREEAGADASAPEVAATESHPGYGEVGPEIEPAPEAPAPVDDDGWYERYSKREARHDGVRLLLDYGTASIEGALPEMEKPTRVGVTLRMPPRYRRPYAQHGLVYAASASVGTLGGEPIGDGQVAVGGALGESAFQLAGLVVLGADRVVDQAPLPPVDSYYGGVAALLRFPLGGVGVGVEASLALLKGSHGDESRIEASLVTGHFAPLTAVLGVRRHGWDDGSSTSVVLGVGF